MYSETVMEHFRNPRNVGEMEDADGIGEVGNPVCGDMMTFYIKVKDDVITDVKFLTFGCGAAIAVSSIVSEMAKGKTLDEAMNITNRAVAEALGGLPKNKLHCSNLGADALHKAIEDYRMKKAGAQGAPAGAAEKTVEARHEASNNHEICTCPYCDMENPMEMTYCKGCGKRLTH